VHCLISISQDQCHSQGGRGHPRRHRARAQLAAREACGYGIGSDPRIGFQFIWPGCGYGGSCFPKDVQALVRTAQQAGYMPELLQAVEAVNQFQKQRLHGLISQHFGGAKGLVGRCFALWGLAFKPNTDDMRDAPSRQLLEALWADGASVAAYDPKAAEEAERLYPEALADGRLILVATKEEATDGADALVICTEWKRYHCAGLRLQGPQRRSVGSIPAPQADL
jgi:UDPglucose 6-dehydrogenase